MAQGSMYTAAELEDRCEEYFRRCRRTKIMTEQVPMLEEQGDGEWKIATDERGRAIMIERQVQSDAGEVLSAEEYLVPPSITGLCLFLGISRETWRKYSQDKRKSRVCEKAKMRVEVYLQQKLLEKDSARGAQFALEYNFGWKERREISTDEKTQQALTAASMSTREKAELMRELGWTLPGEAEELEENKE